MTVNSSRTWKSKNTGHAPYLYVNRSSTNSHTVGGDWQPAATTSWRVSSSYDYSPEYPGMIYNYPVGDYTIDGSSLDIGTDFSPPLDVVVDGDLKADVFEKRIRKEIMAEVQQYISSLRPMIISMATERWIPLIERAKQFNNGVFCFNCGAAIIRGKEQEPCQYCGR